MSNHLFFVSSNFFKHMDVKRNICTKFEMMFTSQLYLCIHTILAGVTETFYMNVHLNSFKENLNFKP